MRDGLSLRGRDDRREKREGATLEENRLGTLNVPGRTYQSAAKSRH